jgi:plasmid stabilization system protein ParE
MSFDVQFNIKVIQDIREAKNWYIEKNEKLDILFSKSILEIIEKIKSNPYSFAIRYKNVRFAYPRIFPFIVHFYIDKSTSSIVIIAIIHNKRDIKIIKKRL